MKLLQQVVVRDLINEIYLSLQFLWNKLCVSVPIEMLLFFKLSAVMNCLWNCPLCSNVLLNTVVPGAAPKSS